jgi:serine/threonine protein kinase/beta-lactam-binding protein with PASTA domain
MTQPRLLGGRYELDGIVGRGGMAEVFRARDIRLDRIVGVKTLRDDLARDQTFQARFRREAQSAASLNHPSIVAVYDTGEDLVGNLPVPYIVMEFVDGRTLRDLLRDDRRLLPERAAEITDGVLRALDYSHRNGIVHRDIKPGNVMLTRAGDVKVMDFGIARAVSDSQMTMTQTAQVIGTAQYLSPEQARGERVDARSDLYSTGCLLYELLTGRPPFTGDSPVAIAYQHVKEDPVPPSQVDPEVPAWADAIVLKAMEKDPADRYQSAGEMRNDIQRALSGAPVAAPMLTDHYGQGTRRMGAPATQVAGRTSAIPPYRYGPDDGSQDGQPPRRKVWPWVALVAVILVLGASIFLIRTLGGSGGGVAIPSIQGQSLTQAEQTLETSGFKIGGITKQASTVVASNQVINSSPAFGSNAPKGSKVGILLSTGPATTNVPSVVGDSKSQAEAALKGAGFKVSVVAGTSTTYGPNTVVNQSPKGGTSQPPGTVITISVTGATVTVPSSLIGETASQAKITLSQAPYNCTVTTTTGSGLPGTPGTVYATNPPPNSTLTPGSCTVQLTVVGSPSTSPPPPSSPPTSPSPSTSPSDTPSP